MCGIIGLISRQGGEEAQDFILDQFEEQKTRGSQGFGLIRVNKNQVKVKRATETTRALFDVSRTQDPIMLFHHRMPTSTRNSVSQTHPMEITHDELEFDYLVLHNGVIRNTEELYKIHTEELGYAYKTKENTAQTYYHNKAFNDTESFAIELARFLDGKGEEIGSFGSQAFLGIKIKKTTQKPHSIFWGTNESNPLIWDETPLGLVIASELNYGYDATKEAYCEILIKDIFNKKLTHKNLADLINYYEIKFKKEPIIPVTPVTVTGFRYPTIYGTSANAPKITTQTNPKETKKEEKNSLDLKTTPEGYTDREWAFQKMGLRSLETINTIILEFYDQLPILGNGYLEYDLETDIPTGDIENVIDEETLLEETLQQIEEYLRSALLRSSKVNAFYDRKESAEDKITLKKMIQEDIKHQSPLPETNTNNDTKTMQNIPKQEFLN
jgi:hypothetical protein